MRAWLMACVLALSAIPAAAQSLAAWTDPAGQVTFSRPAAWPVDRMSDSGPQITHYAAGLAAAECSLYSIARPTTADVSPGTVQRGFAQPLTREQWVQVTQSVGRLFRAPIEIQTTSVDSSGFWPIQLATISSAGDTVLAALQARPGREIWVFCQSFDSRDRTELFNSIMRSVGTPQDAALQAAAAAAAPLAPAPAAQ